MVKPLFVQLWTLRNEMKENFESTISQVSKIGFAGVEPIGLSYLTHDQQSQSYVKNNLKVLSFHCSGKDLIGDKISELIAAAKSYGAKYIVAGSSANSKTDFTTIENIKAIAESYNRAGDIAASHGLKVGHHNHDWEMQIVDGKPAIEHFLSFINNNVIVELDAYWAKAGGADPVEILKNFGKKIPLVHIKDGPVKRGEMMLPFGRGVLDIPGIVAAAKDAEALYVELDDVKVVTHMEAVKESYDYMINKKLAAGK